MKIVDIDNNKLSEGLGRCPKYPQGTRPLTQIRALPEPILAGRQEKGAVAPFLLEQDDPRTLCQETFAAYPRADGTAVFHGFPDNGSAPRKQQPDFAYLESSVDQGR